MVKKPGVVLSVPHDTKFWLTDGRVVKNLYELSRAFEEMSEETYKHHTQENKNDFGNWAYDVFGEQRLGKRLNLATTKEQSQIAVLKHLVSVLTKKR